MTTNPTTNPVTTPSGPTPIRTTGGLGLALRVVVTIGALAVLVQAVLAGQILSGESAAATAHGIGGQIVAVVLLVQLVVAIVAWRARRAPGRITAVTGALLVAVVLQIVVGISSTLAVHVPLGVAIFAGYALLVAAVWRR